VIFEHLLLGLKFLIHKVIHERPRWVRIGLLKADYETSQALKQLKWVSTLSTGKKSTSKPHGIYRKFKAEVNKMA